MEKDRWNKRLGENNSFKFSDSFKYINLSYEVMTDKGKETKREKKLLIQV